MAEGVAAPITTARLTLRSWTDADIAPFTRHLNTPDVMQWLGGVQSDANMASGIARWRACEAEHGHTFWIVERQADGELLGFCGLKRVNAEGAPNPGDMEIGWRLRADAWGRGYAREAAEASLDAAFTRFAAPHVVAITCRQNAASWGLMLRLGMRRARDLDFIDIRMPSDIANNTIVYRIDRGDWTA